VGVLRGLFAAAKRHCLGQVRAAWQTTTIRGTLSSLEGTEPPTIVCISECDAGSPLAYRHRPAACSQDPYTRSNKLAVPAATQERRLHNLESENCTRSERGFRNSSGPAKSTNRGTGIPPPAAKSSLRERHGLSRKLGMRGTGGAFLYDDGSLAAARSGVVESVCCSEPKRARQAQTRLKKGCKAAKGGPYIESASSRDALGISVVSGTGGQHCVRLPVGRRWRSRRADEGEQTALARIGHLRRAKYSLRRIAATLNEQGLRTRRGSPCGSNP